MVLARDVRLFREPPGAAQTRFLARDERRDAPRSRLAGRLCDVERGLRRHGVPLREAAGLQRLLLRHRTRCESSLRVSGALPAVCAGLMRARCFFVLAAAVCADGQTYGPHCRKGVCGSGAFPHEAEETWSPEAVK